MYSGRVWPPFSAAYRVAVSCPSPLNSYLPAAHLLYLDCVVCITFGQEHHLVTAETRGQQQRPTSGPCRCSSLAQNCQPLRPASLNLPPTQLHPHLWPGQPSHLQPSPASGLRQGPAPHLWVWFLVVHLNKISQESTIPVDRHKWCILYEIKEYSEKVLRIKGKDTKCEKIGIT